MTKDGFDTPGIKSDCQQPDPVECFERQTQYAQSGDEICQCCPVASWVRAMVVSGAGTDAAVDLAEAVFPELAGKVLIPELAVKAA